MSLARRRLALILGLAAFAALLLFFPALVVLLTDWWWFREIGYEIVFTRTLTTRLLLFLGAGGITFGLLYLNLRVAQRGLVANPVLLQFAQSAPRLNLTVALRRLTLPLSLWTRPQSPLPDAAWWGFAYVSVFSMWIGFFAWYRGLAQGGTVRVSQVQLLQPFLSMVFAVPLLHERLDAQSVAFALAVIATVFVGRRMPVGRLPATPVPSPAVESR